MTDRDDLQTGKRWIVLALLLVTVYLIVVGSV